MTRARRARRRGPRRAVLPEERLVEAAARVADSHRGRQRGDERATVDRDAGRIGRAAGAAAARATFGSRVPPLVVELEPEVGMAAGRLSQLPGEWFQAARARHRGRRFDRRQFRLRARARWSPARRHRPRRAPTRVGASRDRGSDGATPRRDRDRDRAPALAAPGARATYVATLWSRPRQRRSRSRGAILRAATRGGAVW